MMTGGFTIVDFTIPTRDSPVIHSCTTAPICDDCRSQDLCFFDPTCGGCQDILSNPKTSISELFAIMRQWIPQTQRYLALLTREVLRRGAHIDDKDSLTDLSLLHYACRSGALVNGGTSASLVASIISKGADTNIKCHWTDMNALHYAVYYDCETIVEQLCDHNPALVPTVSNQFDRGNSLHIAAANLSLKSARILINHKCDGGWKDERNRLPHECIPEVISNKDESIANELRDILKIASDNRPFLKPHPARSDSSTSSRSTTNKSIKHTKSITTNGTFNPDVIITTNGDAHSKPLTTFGKNEKSLSKTQSTKGKGTNTHITTPTSPLSSIQSPYSATPPIGGLSTGVSPEEPTLESIGIRIGDKVIVDNGTPKNKVGTLRFYGDTMFASGEWAGIELDDDSGKNDGSHGGIRYFSCKPRRGLFVSLKRISKYIMKTTTTTPRTTKTIQSKDKGKKVPSKTRDRMLTHSHSTEYQVGERVSVKESGNGIIRFVGSVKFGPGVWLGIELDRPKGTCDGSNNDVQYFKCRQNYGVFVYPSKIIKISDSTDRPMSGGSACSSPHYVTPPISRKKQSASPIVKLVTITARTKPRPYTSPVPTSVSLANSPQPTLEKGMSIFTSKERGTLQYIGRTEFAPGLWLGIELKKPNGKNDGSVNSKRYFTCRPNYGIFVKPEKATHRGINCSKLVKLSDH